MDKDNVKEQLAAAGAGAAPTHDKNAGSKKKTFGSFIGDIFTVLLVCIAIYCCFGFVRQYKTGELFFPFGHRAVRILSGSMEDEIHTGAIVIVKKTKDVQKDDIILFISEAGARVIHRYVDNDENGNIITKGDANPIKDLEPVTYDRLVGKVVMKLNWVAGVSNWLLE